MNWMTIGLFIIGWVSCGLVAWISWLIFIYEGIGYVNKCDVQLLPFLLIGGPCGLVAVLIMYLLRLIVDICGYITKFFRSRSNINIDYITRKINICLNKLIG